MLEKNTKNIEFDAHFHFTFTEKNEEIAGCTCAHSIEEWECQSYYKKSLTNADVKKMKLAFGVHPQITAAKNVDLYGLIDYLSALISKNEIDAIGEMGFDFYTPDFKATAAKQEEMFQLQLELALTNNLPVIIHCRKANEKLFENSKLLKKLPAVLFHSFMGTPIEAKSLLSRGINGFFSFGKQILNGNKKVISCVTELPLNCLLCETDAPFQTLKGEAKTYLRDIKKVYEAAWKLRKNVSLEEFYEQLQNNFFALYE